MAAVFNERGGNFFPDEIDFELRKKLKGVDTKTPNLSTLAQKGDEKVIMKLTEILRFV